MSCKAHDVSIGGLAWSPDGQRFATAAADGVVKVIEAQHGSELLTLHTAQHGVSHVAWSPNGKRLAAATDDGTIQVWDAARAYEFAADGSRGGELAWAYYQLADESTGECDRQCAAEIGGARSQGIRLSLAAWPGAGPPRAVR